MSESVYYDGSFDAPVIAGPLLVTYDPEFRCYYAVQVMRQRASLFAGLPIGTQLTIPDKPGAFYLTEESELKHIDADIVEWKRIYWQVPPSLIDRRSYVWNMQWLRLPGGIIERAGKTTATFTRTFVYSEDPSTIIAKRARRWMRFGNVFYRIGNDNDICEDETVERWKGNIWMKLRITATMDDLTPVE